DVAQLSAKLQSRPAGPASSTATILDDSELERMTEAGLQRLKRFQHGDGGWGWWENDQSSPYMTAYVLIGMHVAAESGAKVDEHDFDRGLGYLAKLDQDEEPVHSNPHDSPGDLHAQMMVAYALSLSRPVPFKGEGEHLRDQVDKVLMPQLTTAFEQR